MTRYLESVIHAIYQSLFTEILVGPVDIQEQVECSEYEADVMFVDVPARAQNRRVVTESWIPRHCLKGVRASQ